MAGRIVRPSSQGFQRLAAALASQQHAVNVPSKRSVMPASRQTPASIQDYQQRRKLMRANNPMAAPRQFMEGPGKPALSIKP